MADALEDAIAAYRGFRTVPANERSDPGRDPRDFAATASKAGSAGPRSISAIMA
jgi:hypothetical protein